MPTCSEHVRVFYLISSDVEVVLQHEHPIFKMPPVGAGSSLISLPNPNMGLLCYSHVLSISSDARSIIV